MVFWCATAQTDNDTGPCYNLQSWAQTRLASPILANTHRPSGAPETSEMHPPSRDTMAGLFSHNSAGYRPSELPTDLLRLGGILTVSPVGPGSTTLLWLGLALPGAGTNMTFQLRLDTVPVGLTNVDIRVSTCSLTITVIRLRRSH